MEELVRVPGFPDYSVTSSGRVWSHRSSKWLSPCYSGRKYQYLQVKLCRPDGCFFKKVHLLVAEVFGVDQSKKDK